MWCDVMRCRDCSSSSSEERKAAVTLISSRSCSNEPIQGEPHRPLSRAASHSAHSHDSREAIVLLTLLYSTLHTILDNNTNIPPPLSSNHMLVVAFRNPLVRPSSLSRKGSLLKNLNFTRIMD